MDTEKPKDKADRFISYILGKIESDNACAAALRRADNPDTEYQAWETLVPWCNLEQKREYLPFAVIAAAIARSKPKANGALGLGTAIARCYEDGNNSDAAKAKLRRLLACDTVEEACQILRPIFSIIDFRGVPLNYSKLLSQLLRFGDAVRKSWAMEFFNAKEGVADVSLNA